MGKNDKIIKGELDDSEFLQIPPEATQSEAFETGFEGLPVLDLDALTMTF